MFMENQNFEQSFVQQTSTPAPVAKLKDRVKLFLVITVVVLAVAVLLESFALAVISSNYFGVFESVQYDEEEVSDEDESGLYEEDAEEE